MTASTKDLIERANNAKLLWPECPVTHKLLDDLAAALERLTQPVGVEPFRWIRILTNGAEIVYQRPISEAEAAHISEMGDEFLPVHSAETVARLIAERDAAVAALDAKIDICGDARIQALQEQVKELMAALTFYAEREHFILADPDAWDTVSGEPQNLWEDEANTATVEDGSVARQALAATEPKEGEKK